RHGTFVCNDGGLRVDCQFPELVVHDQVRVCNGWRRLLAGEGHRRRVSRRHPRFSRHPRHQSQARPVHQRRSRDDESVPARGGVRHRGRRRDVSAPSSVTNTSPCWNGLIVPGSTLMYGSSLRLVTRMPREARMAARDAAAMPFPSEETTPPVTNTNLVMDDKFWKLAVYPKSSVVTNECSMS